MLFLCSEFIPELCLYVIKRPMYMSNKSRKLTYQRPPLLGEQRTRLLWETFRCMMSIQKIDCILYSFR